MSNQNGNAPEAPASAPGQEIRVAKVAGISFGKSTTERARFEGLFSIYPDEGEPFKLYVKGRVAWALDQLVTAGPKGCTPIDQPAPRWSAYVHKLRESGVPIETVTEPHGGPYSGHHGRYVLRAKVRTGGEL